MRICPSAPCAPRSYLVDVRNTYVTYQCIDNTHIFEGYVYLTKQTDDASSAPRQAGDEIQTGVPQIEVTPEMVDAGVSAILRWEESADYSYERVVRSIFLEMLSKLPSLHQSRQRK